MRIGNSVLRDVLVGEVWLCSGQSNMRWIVGHVDKFPGVEGAEEEIARSERPELRLFSDDGEEVWQQRGWQRASGERVARFSATAYFFGRELHKAQATPVGLINSSWGGTPIEAWTFDGITWAPLPCRSISSRSSCTSAAERTNESAT